MNIKHQFVEKSLIFGFFFQKFFGAHVRLFAVVERLDGALAAANVGGQEQVALLSFQTNEVQVGFHKMEHEVLIQTLLIIV